VFGTKRARELATLEEAMLLGGAIRARQPSISRRYMMRYSQMHFFAKLAFLISFISLLSIPAVAQAQSADFDRAPIHYQTAEVHDPVAKLASAIAAGQQQLDWDAKHGYLPAILDVLEVPVSSQTLVFSKTSLQLHRISPSRPRAVYFNDDVYVGWCQNGDVVELAATDPKQGAVFYTLSQNKDAEINFVRDRGQAFAERLCQSAIGQDFAEFVVGIGEPFSEQRVGAAACRGEFLFRPFQARERFDYRSRHVSLLRFIVSFVSRVRSRCSPRRRTGRSQLFRSAGTGKCWGAEFPDMTAIILTEAG
jgi:hypothetical protein